MRERECLKMILIGQSATKPRIGEGSTTIPYESRGKRLEVMRVRKDEDIVCASAKAGGALSAPAISSEYWNRYYVPINKDI